MLNDLGLFELILLGVGCFGAGLVALKFILQLLGADGDADLGGDVDFGGDADIHELHGDTDSAFAFLSLHTVSSFMMMFGLVGFAVRNGHQWSVGATLVAGAVAGVIAVMVIRKIFKSASKLQASGNITIDQALDQTGTVYMRIPADGLGVVHVTVCGARREYSARSESGEELQTGKLIKVVSVEGNAVVVVPTK